jgi:hypothetical protein
VQQELPLLYARARALSLSPSALDPHPPLPTLHSLHLNHIGFNGAVVIEEALKRNKTLTVLR